MTARAAVVLRDAGIVYGLTFSTGVGMALAGVTLFSDPWTTYLANLLSGATGFLLSGIRTRFDRLEHLAWVAATLWTFNLINIVLGLQSTASWIYSGVTVLLMAVIGGTLSTLFTRAPSLIRPPRTAHKSPVG